MQHGSQHIPLESSGMSISCQQQQQNMGAGGRQAEGETENVLTVGLTDTAQNNSMHV